MVDRFLGMCTIVKGLCILSFYGVSVCIGLVDAKRLSEENRDYDELSQFSYRLRHTESGIFKRFLRNILTLLTTTFPPRKLRRYCRILSKEFEVMDYKPTKKLAKYFRSLSKTDRDEVKETFTEYRQQLKKQSSRLTEFLQSMNDVFTLQESIRFDDYIHDLQDYGTEDKLDIHTETKKLLDVIVHAVNKRSYMDQRKLLRNMKKAMREEGSHYDSILSPSSSSSS